MAYSELIKDIARIRDYINNFRIVLQALRERRKLQISYSNRIGRMVTGTYNPWKLEYSAKDDKFRLVTNAGQFGATINIGRMTACELSGEYDPDLMNGSRREASLTFELTDKRNALERVMLHFSDCRKETRRLDDKHYHVTLWYDSQDETEILIRVLSFGQMIRVTSPESFINLIKERIIRQKNLFRG
jgi:predicted DNA-binding transcriptional regulator YafY